MTISCSICTRTEEEVTKSLLSLGIYIGSFTARLPVELSQKTHAQLGHMKNCFLQVTQEIKAMSSARVKVLLSRSGVFCAHRLSLLYWIFFRSVPRELQDFPKVNTHSLRIEERLWLISEKIGILAACWLGEQSGCVGRPMLDHCTKQCLYKRSDILQKRMTEVFEEISRYRESPEKNLRFLQYSLCKDALSSIQELGEEQLPLYPKRFFLSLYVQPVPMTLVEYRHAFDLLNLGPQMMDDVFFIKEAIKEVYVATQIYVENKNSAKEVKQELMEDRQKALSAFHLALSRLSEGWQMILLQGVERDKSKEGSYLRSLLLWKNINFPTEIVCFFTLFQLVLKIEQQQIESEGDHPEIWYRVDPELDWDLLEDDDDI
ncbi:MAG: hypothetical protein FJZ58_03580 [Chlamydiae bacterium]|nr:hypothetical protein [Chlamydiota bacterium]